MGVDACLLRVLLLLALLSLSFFSRAQTSFASTRLAGVELSNDAPVSFDELIPKVAQHYKVNFLFSSDFLPKAKKTAPDFQNYNLSEILALVFNGSGIEYSVNGNNILLRKSAVAPPSNSRLHRFNFRKASPPPKLPELVALQKLPFELAGLKAVNFDQITLVFAREAASYPSFKEPTKLSILPVKLGPVYVQPRKHYDFLDRMGEPVKKIKPNMKLVLTNYANTSSRETDETLYKYRLLNLSVAPGLGTNGLNPGTFYNGLSFNLTVDYSAGNNLVGLAGISNFSKYSAYGLQLAGLVNVVGGDLRQHRNYTRSELLEMRAPFRGIQFAGLGNIVTGDVRGIEGSLGFNITGGSSRGWQLSGLSNLTAEGVRGIQTTGLLNYAGLSVSGMQLAAVNYTKGDLHGVQVGVLNRNRSMSNPGYATLYGDGLQFGLLNTSGSMGGYQVGLVNLAGNMNGFQLGFFNSSKNARGCHIGLVNIFQEHNGHAFGLLNFGKSYSARLWANETFPSHIGIVTGTDKISNIIFYSRNFLFPSPQGVWPIQAFGYGLSKGSVFDPRDLTYLEFFDYRFHVSWVNFSGVQKQPFNILFNPHVVYGRKIQKDLYFTVGGGLNAWWTPEVENYRLSRLEVASFKDTGNVWKFWPGVTLGIEMM